ncbi:MAG TPA: sigma-54-dependent Fis family transcriptional regulator [Steroidobacteraceae bacterium]|nr:sigma-54-dependent Fis family transcriptional regulator [Steroidobacteraceae bacterium]HVC02664.1 sigma-54-dependent Fis family transcriptional regulator [Steroidobacteraceae bacterium]
MNRNVATSHATRIIRVVESGVQPAGIEPHISRSWYRCLREFGIEPSAQRRNEVLNPQTVRELQQRMGELLPIARAEMESLYEQIAGSSFAVILSDTRGAVLSSITDPSLQREFRQAGLSVGALWDERHEGTNGIGTCLAEGAPVTVHREEHFLGYNLALSCSAAPILDPHGGLIAVLDASTANSSDSRLIQRHTMALVNMSASLISRWNFMHEFAESWILRFHSRAEFVGLLHEALIAIDRSGTILAANESALLQLGCASRGAAVGRSIEHWFQFDFGTLEQRARSDPGAIWPVRDLAHGRRFFAVVRAPLRVAGGRGGIALTESPGQVTGQTAAPQRGVAHVGEDPAMHRNMSFGRQLFAKQVPILLQGATGTGKEAFAKALHRGCLWSDKAFVTVNCAAIPENLIESELFGYARGAFTGAVKEGRIGKILQSSGGTLFLDEIGDMPLMLQTRLLRVIEEREVVPVGSDHPIPVNPHVISATHRDIRKMVESGEFREDLYYRLNGMTLHLPLLRDRTDIADVIQVLLREETAEHESIDIADDALRRLLEYAWPGNIRQLRNALRTASALCRDGVIRLANLPQEILDTEPRVPPRAIAADPVDPAAAQPGALRGAALREAECAALIRELERMHWNISRTAQALGVSRNTLYRKIHKHRIVLGQ